MSYRPLAASNYFFQKNPITASSATGVRLGGRTRLRVGQILFASPRSLHSGFDQAGHTCAADADLLAEIERLRERATTYGLVAAVAVALALITVIVASNAQTASAATARASLTPQRPAPKVVSYQSLAPDDSAKEPYRSPFDSPTI